MSRCYVQLAKSGDVLNILPMLKRDFDSGHKPHILVHKDFASVCEGVGYAETHVWDGEVWDIVGATKHAESMGFETIVTQMFGKAREIMEHAFKRAGLPEGQGATSWDQESYRLAGRHGEWLKDDPIVFDRRDKEREQSLLSKIPKRIGRNASKVKTILVAANGNTSPFPHRELLLELLRLKFIRGYHIIDLGAIKAERIYDLLALYEQAYCLVAIDTALLHLARAAPTLPVIALTNDQPSLWNGTGFRPQHAWYCRYSDFPKRAVEMLSAITGLDRWKLKEDRLHLWNAYDGEFHLKSPIIEFPICIGMCGRDSHNTIGDEKRIPYLKDCISMGLRKLATDDCLLMITRPDTRFKEAVLPDDNRPMFAYRLVVKDGAEAFAPVPDMFRATRAWWKAHLKEIPDLLLGRDTYWPQCLWAMFKKHGAVDVTGTGLPAGKMK